MLSLVARRAASSAAAKSYKLAIPAPMGIFIPDNMSGSTFGSDIPKQAVTTKEELLEMYRVMSVIRRVEIVSDLQYKQRKIRGFCHLYSGEEAICTGMEFGMTRQDALITAYRDHGNQIVRGDTAESVFAELFGRATGCSKGKGGSMHFYKRDANFFGGNGIVGAQCPVGTGVAFAQKYLGEKTVTFACFGDGAANQGQIFEAINMAALWKLPVIFVCENNQYGMGTSTKRAAAIEEYYKRGQFIPGLRIDGMHILGVKEASKYAANYCREGNGPVYMEFNTYRYSGHSMSDPGISYRTRDEVQNVRTTRDPILNLQKLVLENSIVTEEELKEIERQVKEEVDAALARALEAPEPSADQLGKDIYMEDVAFRGPSLSL